ncbi:heterokaryon incompatibility protein-domain-containing protein [Zalerion maritima]|uniref:Heterokaryon incompatibility protein-domain-containing protein n=1 Tax=Zalerion maritima TaxID=339359 RepID=A0AAD5S086_9PEZI|nr:heterokaryon incompatibility protein-domain-containing protein [Zalerion maritima]
MSQDTPPGSPVGKLVISAPRRRSTMGSFFGAGQKDDKETYSDPPGITPRRWWIDFSKMQAWLNHCDSNHGHQCRGLRISISGNTFKPHWAIDVERSRVVPYIETGGADYVALSYVWGDAPRGRQLELLCENRDRLKVDGVLHRLSHLIPGSILTAMAATLQLGYRYLWVDRLCIVQDEADTKHSQIYHMASIYSNASLTIVATETAEVPLWGVKPFGPTTCTPRQVIETWCPWRWTFAQRLKSSTWKTRAWTFQELLFSRRAIVFFENGIHCLCHCGQLQYSELPSKTPSERATQLLGEYQLFGWPDLNTYAAIVKDYVQRKVSVEIDFLNAFTGLSTTLSRGFFGIHYGLPEVFFDVALLWYPACKTNPLSPGRYPLPLRRRLPHLDGSQLNPLPSWSWMGWNEPYGRLDLWYWLTVNPKFVKADTPQGSQKSGSESSIITTPIVEWHMELLTSDDAPENTSRRTRSNLAAYIEPPAPGSRKSLLPSGWKLFDGDNFVHFCDPDTRFQHPIPISDEPTFGKSRQELSPVPILRFKAHGAWFNIDNPGDPYLRYPDGNTTRPLNVGYLWLHDEVFKESLVETPSVNVIAVSEAQISRGELNDKTFWARDSEILRPKIVSRVIDAVARSSKKHRRPSGGSAMSRFRILDDLHADPVCFYNVLCIKGTSYGDGEIVERVGVGTVLKSAFDALANEDPVETRLG